MHSRIFWQAIYWSPIPALAALIAILLRRRLVREFPFFFTYIVVLLVRNVAGFITYRDSGSGTSAIYGYTYWISHLITSVFILFATYELSVIRLFPRFYRVNFYRHLFTIVGVIAICLAGIAVYGVNELVIMAKAIHLIDILQVIAMFFFVALMQFMGRHWSRYDFAIAVGLGINAVSFVIYFVLYLKLGYVHSIVRQLPPLASVLACLFWLVAFSRPQTSNFKINRPVQPEVLQEAQKWEQALKDSLTTKKPPINRGIS